MLDARCMRGNLLGHVEKSRLEERPGLRPKFSLFEIPVHMRLKHAVPEPGSHNWSTVRP